MICYNLISAQTPKQERYMLGTLPRVEYVNTMLALLKLR